MKDLINELGEKVKNKELSWFEAVQIYNSKTGEGLSSEALRKRYKRISEMPYTAPCDTTSEFETQFNDGTIEAQKIIEYNKEILGDKKKLLKFLGYEPSQWEFVYLTTSLWQQHTKEQTTKQLYAVKYKVKPIIKELELGEALQEAIDVFKKEIKPYKRISSKQNEELDPNKLLELTGIELHLGKMAWVGDTGQSYDKNIAQDRFYYILDKVIEQQQIEKCNTCLLCIGNDFFNSDTINATTTKGTPQTNDLRWKKMFNLGLEMYVKMINTLLENFNQIDIRLQSGNHDMMSSFYLYIALSCFYKDNPKIEFSTNYKEVQCYEWGKCAIFYSHGEGNLKRLIKSIPAEFYKEWGSSIYRELHLGHLHKEVVVDDESGMITRRVGSPTGTDQWHYEERYIGATQKYQTFVWNKELGLESIKYINFEPSSELKLVRKDKR